MSNSLTLYVRTHARHARMYARRFGATNELCLTNNNSHSHLFAVIQPARLRQGASSNPASPRISDSWKRRADITLYLRRHVVQAYVDRQSRAEILRAHE
jgi:hypothetical protein